MITTDLTAVASKISAGKRLSGTELETLAATHDLLRLGALADEVRRRRHGDCVTFVRVAEIRFDVETMSPPPTTAGEVRIVGVPRRLPAALDLIRRVREAAWPIPVSGFSLSDLEGLAGEEGLELAQLLAELRAAGLELVAEAPVDRLVDPQGALDAASHAGLPIARLTVHTLALEERIPLLQRVAALEQVTDTVHAFAPLARASQAAAASTGYDDVKQVALARVLVDNIDSIQVDWALYGPKLAQVALTVGANDVDAVSPFDTLEFGARRAPLEEIRRNIRAASLTPAERNGRFARVS